MIGDFVKRPLGGSLNRLAQQRAQEAIQRTGRALPCHVVAIPSPGTVTVAFDVDPGVFTLPQVTIPLEAWEWVRYPIQIGTRGVTRPADVRLGYASGMGGGVPGMVQPANLTALLFSPIGRTDWSASDDSDAVVIYGPNGAILRTTDSSHKAVVNADGVNLDDNIKVKSDQLAFFGGNPADKATVSGALSSVTDPAAKAVLTSLINALAGYTLIENGTT